MTNTLQSITTNDVDEFHSIYHITPSLLPKHINGEDCGVEVLYLLFSVERTNERLRVMHWLGFHRAI